MSFDDLTGLLFLRLPSVAYSFILLLSVPLYMSNSTLLTLVLCLVGWLLTTGTSGLSTLTAFTFLPRHCWNLIQSLLLLICMNCVYSFNSMSWVSLVALKESFRLRFSMSTLFESLLQLTL